MVNNQSLDGGSPDVSKVDDSGLLGNSDVFLITVIVVASILFIVIVAIIAVMISSNWKTKSPGSEKSSKNYAPGSAKRHYLATPENKSYLLNKYTSVPYMVPSNALQKVPLRNFNPIYRYDGQVMGITRSLSLLNQTATGPAAIPATYRPTGDKSLLVAPNGGSPMDGLAVPAANTIQARSVTSDLMEQLKDFQHMRKPRKMVDSPL